MIIISINYIVNYIANDKYIYGGEIVHNCTNDCYELNYDEELNPYLNITIKIFDDYIDKFSVRDEFNYQSYEKLGEYKFRAKPQQIHLTINYLCGDDDENCTSFKSFNSQYGLFIIEYPQFVINHHNNPPVIFDSNEQISISNTLNLPGEALYQWDFEWEVIKYHDEKSFSDIFTDKKTDYIFGQIKDHNPYRYFISPYQLEEKKIEILSIQIFNPHKDYNLYHRKKIGFLDVISKIGALFSTIKFIFSFVFHFYSKNFDNYKIVENILQSTKEPIKNEIELTSKLNDLKSKEDYVNINLINKKITPLMEEEEEENPKENKLNNDNNNNSEDITLKKLSFYDFFFNNIYCKCCKRIKNQEIINDVNNVIYKYLSADSLLYNQIKIENLLSDYKWNNLSLNEIKNNNLIIKLKYY